MQPIFHSSTFMQIMLIFTYFRRKSFAWNAIHTYDTNERSARVHLESMKLNLLKIRLDQMLQFHHSALWYSVNNSSILCYFQITRYVKCEHPTLQSMPFIKTKLCQFPSFLRWLNHHYYNHQISTNETMWMNVAERESAIVNLMLGKESARECILKCIWPVTMC